MTDRDLRSRVIAAGVSPDAPVSAVMTEPAYTAAAGLDPMIVSLRDAQVAAEQVAAVRSVVLDALTRRLVELAVGAEGDPPAPFTWFALGSLARREAVPSSDVDSALAWQEPQDRDRRGRGGEYMTRVAHAVEDGLRACGLRPDAHGASAANPLFARSVASWRAAARRFSEDPTQEKALIFVSLITDSRPVWDSGRPAPPSPRRCGRHGASSTSPTCGGCWPGSPCRSGRPPGSCAISWSSTPASTGGSWTSSTVG